MISAPELVTLGRERVVARRVLVLVTVERDHVKHSLVPVLALYDVFDFARLSHEHARRRDRRRRRFLAAGLGRALDVFLRRRLGLGVDDRAAQLVAEVFEVLIEDARRRRREQRAVDEGALVRHLEDSIREISRRRAYLLRLVGFAAALPARPLLAPAAGRRLLELFIADGALPAVLFLVRRRFADADRDHTTARRLDRHVQPITHRVERR